MEATSVEKPKRVPKAKKVSTEIKLLEDFTVMATLKGCPWEQIENFIKAGVILQAKQLEFCGLARQCDLPDGPKAILSGGGRGSAKSHGIFAQIFCDDCQRVPGLKCLFLRKVGGANKEQVSDFVRKILVRLPHKYRESAPAKVEFPNGSFVILGNFKDEKDIDKYLGLEYDLIYIMESNQLTQTKKMNILSCLRTNKQNWRPRCYQDTNPGGIDHVANKRLFVDPWKAGRETETRYVHSTVDDNAFVDKGYKEYLEKLVGW
jgi:phage terminase large subunit